MNFHGAAGKKGKSRGAKNDMQRGSRSKFSRTRISILTTRIPSVTRDFSLFPRRGTLRVADDYYCSACAERKAFSRRGFKKDFSLRRPGGERLLIFLGCRPIDIAIFKPCSVAIGIISFYGAQQSLKSRYEIKTLWRERRIPEEKAENFKVPSRENAVSK